MLIAVEGCIGVGKTTVARGLGKLRQSIILLEDFESNPFLESFYEDPVPNAIETEFAFLLLHFNQLRQFSDPAFAPKEVIADFHIWKDLIYADLNLSGPGIVQAFNELYGALVERVPSPTLMLCLSATTEFILDRIAARNRHLEVRIDPEYVARVNDAYGKAFNTYRGRKLCLPMDRWDFVKVPALFAELNEMISHEIRDAGGLRGTAQ